MPTLYPGVPATGTGNAPAPLIASSGVGAASGKVTRSAILAGTGVSLDGAAGHLLMSLNTGTGIGAHTASGEEEHITADQYRALLSPPLKAPSEGLSLLKGKPQPGFPLEGDSKRRAD